MAPLAKASDALASGVANTIIALRGPIMIIVGGDCGTRGGLAAVAVEDGTAPHLITAINVSVVGTNAKERV
jgi:hypothetical protein